MEKKPDDHELIVEVLTTLDGIDTILSELRQDMKAYIESEDEQERLDIINHLHGDVEPITDKEINDLRDHALDMLEEKEKKEDDNA